MVVNWVARDIGDWEHIAFVEKTEERELNGKTTCKSLDSSIMEMADDIAYGIHDLEDAVSLRFVNKQLFEEEVRKFLLKPLLSEHFGSLDNDAYGRWLSLLFSSETFGVKKS